MQGKVDLHTHSNVSDGSMSPIELVDFARDKNIKVLALTDHDTNDGVIEASERAKELGISFVSGIEISTGKNNEIHILGYFSGDNHLKLNDYLDYLKKNRSNRNYLMVEKLQNAGVDISMDDILAVSDEGSIGRAHFAYVLMKKGYVKSVSEAFDKYVGLDGVGYVKKESLNISDTIERINEANGIAVFAHPGYLKLGDDEYMNLFYELKSKGLEGVEVYYPSHTKSQRELFLDIARENDLIVTGGSDFHGAIRPEVKIGMEDVPYKCYEDILYRLGMRGN